MLSEKITLVLSVWILIILIVTGDANLEIFFILIFIGVLVLRELTDIFTTSDLKDRMNLFIYIFLIIFVIIVGRKILEILNV